MRIPKYIVERDSANLFADSNDAETFLGIEGTHSEMCKFDDFRDPKFLRAKPPILDVINYARHPNQPLSLSSVFAPRLFCRRLTPLQDRSLKALLARIG